MSNVEFGKQKYPTPPPDDELIYRDTPEAKLALYVYKPSDWHPSDRRTMLFFVHGGGWVAGSPALFAEQCCEYAKSGYVCLSAAYRLAEKENADSYFRSLKDVKSALRYAKVNAVRLGADGDKIVGIGSSAGAQLLLRSAVAGKINHPDDDLAIDPAPAKLILMSPVVDIGAPPGYDKISAVLDEDGCREFSPLANLRAKMPEQLILLGDIDDILSVEHARNYCKRVREYDNDCSIAIFAGAPHGAFYHGEFMQKSRPKILEFISS